MKIHRNFGIYYAICIVHTLDFYGLARFLEHDRAGPGPPPHSKFIWIETNRQMKQNIEEKEE